MMLFAFAVFLIAFLPRIKLVGKSAGIWVAAVLKEGTWAASVAYVVVGLLEKLT
jgi:hypothetical protein